MNLSDRVMRCEVCKGRGLLAYQSKVRVCQNCAGYGYLPREDDQEELL